MLAIHEEQLASHGGGIGIREEGLLASALSRPIDRAADDEIADCAAVAASYGFGIAEHRPFIDGNKRTAYVAMELCLHLSGFRLNASDADAVLMMLRLAAGEVDDLVLADWITSRLTPR